MTVRLLLLAWCLVIWTTDSPWAYELLTHRQLSFAASDASRLAEDPTILESLGLGSYAQQQLRKADGLFVRIPDLIAQGAADEDAFVTPLNHFFDPVHNRPITRFGLPWGHRSPNWALEDIDHDLVGQDSSFFDARRQELAALSATTPAIRNAQWARTFESLGHVVHHLQDMAQPQHVRNDAHGEGEWYEPAFLLGKKSLFEYTVNEYLKKSPFAEILQSVGVRASAREYWASAGDGIAEFTNRNFVSAEANFWGDFYHILPDHSATEVIPDGRYAYPFVPEQSNAITEPTWQDLLNEEIPDIPSSYTGNPPPLDGRLYFIGTSILDASGAEIALNNRTSTFSIWDADLTQYNTEPCEDPTPIPPPAECLKATFTLNRFNIFKAKDFLLPRAVNTSAGLLDYFFRGRIEACYGGPTAETLLENEGPETMNGTVDVYVDDQNGLRQRVGSWSTASRLPQTNGNWDPGMILSVPAFDAPSPGRGTVVFHGIMGNEIGSDDEQGAVVSRVIDTNLHCVRSLWSVGNAGLLEYPLDDSGLPSQSPQVISPDPAVGPVRGVAFDPTDGYLWVSEQGTTGVIHKVTRDGDLVRSLTVTGTYAMGFDGCGQLTGDPQRSFSGIAMDPLDLQYVWVAGGCGPYYAGTAALYKVKVDDGSVAFRCQASIFSQAPAGGVGGTSMLATARLGNQTLLLARPFGTAGFDPPNWMFTYKAEKLFGEGCGSLGRWYLYPEEGTPPKVNNSVLPLGAAIVGTRNRLIVALDECPTGGSCASYVDHIGPMSSPGDLFIFTRTGRAPIVSIGSLYGDIALGSSF